MGGSRDGVDELPPLPAPPRIAPGWRVPNGDSEALGDAVPLTEIVAEALQLSSGVLLLVATADRVFDAVAVGERVNPGDFEDDDEPVEVELSVAR